MTTTIDIEGIYAKIKRNTVDAHVSAEEVKQAYRSAQIELKSIEKKVSSRVDKLTSNKTIDSREANKIRHEIDEMGNRSRELDSIINIIDAKTSKWWD